MERRIVGFLEDDAGDWVAELDCGHTQHVRHKPPFENRGWVATSEGRAQKIGQVIECVHCPEPELPPGAAPYRRTDEFTELTIPDGLKRAHRTKPGVWAKIIVEEGKLRFVRESEQSGSPGRARVLRASAFAVVPPEAPHHVEAVGPVRFYVEFWRVP